MRQEMFTLTGPSELDGVCARAVLPACVSVCVCVCARAQVRCLSLSFAMQGYPTEGDALLKNSIC